MIKNAAFAKDVSSLGGYAYTAGRLSSEMSNARISKSILGMTSFAGKKVIDIGCGDGLYSLELARSGAASVLAIDPVEAAIDAAKEKYRDVKNLRFEHFDLYEMKVPDETYDIAVVRGVLHHLCDLEKGVEIISKMAKTILVMEPNGYNPVLKIIEKTSKYHIEHGEKSFTPARLRKLFEKNNGKIVFEEFVGLVPFFCPDFFARILKFFEKFFERTPLINKISCGQFMFAVAIGDGK